VKISADQLTRLSQIQIAGALFNPCICTIVIERIGGIRKTIILIENNIPNNDSRKIVEIHQQTQQNESFLKRKKES
jgi:hypothetical protein